MNNSFPYGSDRYFAPRTAGIIVDTGDIPVGNIEIPPPSGNARNGAQPVSIVGTVTPYIGDTSCVYANQINYAQMAGTD